MAKPLAIDLFCGLGGWTEGLLAEGYDVVGFDIERHVYGEHRYPAQLVLQDVTTLHGRQFKDATLIVASPPCQAYSYMAMPWTRAKDQAKAIRADKSGIKLNELNRLFRACFRIQREASEAAGRHIPMVVENVKGAQPWVGRARWSFGSFYLWGDVPALMPIVKGRPKYIMDDIANGQRRQAGGVYVDGIKNTGNSWFNIAHSKVKGNNPDGRKGGGTSARKAASAMIAKIPLPLSRHIAAVYKPKPCHNTSRSGGGSYEHARATRVTPDGNGQDLSSATDGQGRRSKLDTKPRGSPVGHGLRPSSHSSIGG